MDKFSLDILKELIRRYNNSILSKGGSSRNLKIKLTIADKELSTYRGRDSFKYINDNDAKLAALEKKKFIFVRRDQDEQLESIELNLQDVEGVRQAIGAEDRNKILERLVEIFNNSPQEGFVREFANAELEYIERKYAWHTSYYKNEQELDSVLKILNAMGHQTEEIMERDFSVRTLGDSKMFAALKSKVIAIAKKFDNALVFKGESNSEDEILLNYNIVKNSTYALVKGNLNFQLKDQVIELSKLGYEFSLSDSMIKEMRLLPSKFSKLITVENLTSFHKIQQDDAVIIFLSGFHNHTKQLLIKKIYEHFAILECLHFGDIDVGGFMIFNNLVQATNIPFKPYKMGVDELRTNFQYLKSLTCNDIQRLQNLKNDSSYKIFEEVIDFMLEHNVKLEQEILD